MGEKNNKMIRDILIAKQILDFSEFLFMSYFLNTLRLFYKNQSC